MWADSQGALTERLANYLESYRWHLISVESAHPVEEDRQYGDEIAQMIEGARQIEDAIIIGRVYSYKPD